MIQANTIVFDLWYTLVCPEDLTGPRTSSRDQIPTLLGLDAAHFAAYWTRHQKAIYNSTQPLRQLLEAYAEGIGRRLDPADLNAFDRIWYDHDRALCNPRPAILGALDELRSRGFHLGLLSNAHEREMRRWPESPFAERFDAACFSYEIGVSKPATEAYGHILKRLGVNAAMSCHAYRLETDRAEL